MQLYNTFNHCQGDHWSGKHGNVRGLDRCHGKCHEINQKSWKISCPGKLLPTSRLGLCHVFSSSTPARFIILLNLMWITTTWVAVT